MHLHFIWSGQTVLPTKIAVSHLEQQTEGFLSRLEPTPALKFTPRPGPPSTLGHAAAFSEAKHPVWQVLASAELLSALEASLGPNVSAGNPVFLLQEAPIVCKGTRRSLADSKLFLPAKAFSGAMQCPWVCVPVPTCPWEPGWL